MDCKVATSMRSVRRHCSSWSSSVTASSAPRSFIALAVFLARRVEAIHRRPYDARADLASILPGDAGIDDWSDAGCNDTVDVDSGRHSPIREEGDLEFGMLPHRNLVHLQVHPDHLFWTSALIGLQRKGRSLGEATQSHSFVDRAFTTHPGDILLG